MNPKGVGAYYLKAKLLAGRFDLPFRVGLRLLSKPREDELLFALPREEELLLNVPRDDDLPFSLPRDEESRPSPRREEGNRFDFLSNRGRRLLRGSVVLLEEELLGLGSRPSMV